MSVVLAIKENGKVWLAADSQATRGDEKMLLTDPNNFKVWRPKMHEHLIMGGVGTLRDLNIVSTVDVWFDEYTVVGSQLTAFELEFAEVVRTIVPALQNEMTSNGGHCKSSFFLAYKDKCFSIDADGCVVELYHEGDWAAIGSGDTVAEAAYAVLHDIESISTKEKIIRAVGQSCEQDLGVNYPILIMNTQDTSLEIYDGQYLHVDDETAIAFEDITEYEDNKMIEKDLEDLFIDCEPVKIEDLNPEDLRAEITD